MENKDYLEDNGFTANVDAILLGEDKVNPKFINKHNINKIMRKEKQEMLAEFFHNIISDYTNHILSTTTSDYDMEEIEFGYNGELIHKKYVEKLKYICSKKYDELHEFDKVGGRSGANKLRTYLKNNGFVIMKREDV